MTRNLLLILLFIVGAKVPAACQVIFRLELNDCNACYGGLSYTRAEAIDSTINHEYVFQSKYIIDSVKVRKKFAIKGNNCSIIFSDEKFYEHSKSATSELILVSPDTVVVFPLRFVSRGNIPDIKRLIAQQQVSGKLPPTPSDFQGTSDGKYYVMHDMIDDSYSIIGDNVKKQYLSLNQDDVYNKIKLKYPDTSYGFRYDSSMADNIAMRPNLRAVHVLNDSQSVGLANVFFEDYYDSMITQTIMMKRERFILYFTRGKIKQLYHINEAEIKRKGFGINEIGNFALQKDSMWLTTYKRDEVSAQNTDTKLCKYVLKDGRLQLDSVLEIKAPLPTHQSHPTFNVISLICSEDYMAIRYFNSVYHKSGEEIFKLPIADSLLINSNMQRVSYGITSMVQVGDTIALLYFINSIRQCGVYNTSTKRFTNIPLQPTTLKSTTLVLSDNQLAIMYLVPESRELKLLKL
jgi:hypothetical protein